MALRYSQNLGLIKVVMTAKPEREETTTDDSSRTTKTSHELKAEDNLKVVGIIKLPVKSKSEQISQGCWDFVPRKT